jgi:GNAT superfamily N-acetyltransferase
MNDLYVDEAARGEGVGRALIEASAAVARDRGALWLEWSTAPDNHTAQRLYDSTGATSSPWLEYELPVDRA